MPVGESKTKLKFEQTSLGQENNLIFSSVVEETTGDRKMQRKGSQ